MSVNGRLRSRVAHQESRPALTNLPYGLSKKAGSPSTEAESCLNPAHQKAASYTTMLMFCPENNWRLIIKLLYLMEKNILSSHWQPTDNPPILLCQLLTVSWKHTQCCSCAFPQRTEMCDRKAFPPSLPLAMLGSISSGWLTVPTSHPPGHQCWGW